MCLRLGYEDLLQKSKRKLYGMMEVVYIIFLVKNGRVFNEPSKFVYFAKCKLH